MFKSKNSKIFSEKKGSEEKTKINKKEISNNQMNISSISASKSRIESFKSKKISSDDEFTHIFSRMNINKNLPHINRYRAEVYAINSILEEYENKKFEQFKVLMESKKLNGEIEHESYEDDSEDDPTLIKIMLPNEFEINTQASNLNHAKGLNKKCKENKTKTVPNNSIGAV
jgi:hypothetical protein